MSSDTKQDSPQSPYPECSCGAGICNLVTEYTGKDKGRKKFVCPVKKGQGACNFIQWQDGLGNAINGDTNTLSLTSDSREKDKATYEEDLNGIVPSGSASEEKELKKMPSSEHLVEEEMLGLDFRVDNLRMGDLKLSETKTSVVAKLGACFRCGKEGH